jgi:hypothetical protein
LLTNGIPYTYLTQFYAKNGIAVPVHVSMDLDLDLDMTELKLDSAYDEDVCDPDSTYRFYLLKF